MSQSLKPWSKSRNCNVMNANLPSPEKTLYKDTLSLCNKNVSYQCDECKSTLTQKISLQRHIEFVHQNVSYKPAKLSKVHFSRKFQGKMHLNFWLSGSPISPYFHPKNLPIPPKVYLLKVQGTKSKASIDFHCPLWQIPLSSRQLIRIQTLLSPLWSPSRFVLAILHEQAFPKYIF